MNRYLADFIRSPITRTFVLGTLCHLGGCASIGPKADPSLDPDSGEMVMALREPVVYAKADPALSATARDYLYLGPVETNHSGAQALYLWIGIASTIDRRRTSTAQDQFTTVVLSGGDRTVELRLEEWHDDARDGPFKVRVPLLQSMRAPIQAADFEALAEADEVTLALQDAKGTEVAFAHWDGHWSNWQNASAEGEIGFGVKVNTLSRR